MGSEMCIRDSPPSGPSRAGFRGPCCLLSELAWTFWRRKVRWHWTPFSSCSHCGYDRTDRYPPRGACGELIHVRSRHIWHTQESVHVYYSKPHRHTDVLWFALGPQCKQVAPLPETELEARNTAVLVSSSSSASAFSASSSHHALNLAADAAIPSLNGVAGCATCLLYTSPSPRDGLLSRMPSSA